MAIWPPRQRDPITDVALQREVWEVRKAGLNIMMSMKGDGKAVSSSRIAVPLKTSPSTTIRSRRSSAARHGRNLYAHAWRNTARAADSHMKKDARRKAGDAEEPARW